MRTFGVEIECGHPQGWEGVVRLFGRSDCSREWSIGRDGSGVEARTPILSGASGFKELKKGMNLLRSTGGYVTRRDGLHVHHGAEELFGNKDLAVLLVKSWAINSDVIEKFVDRRRCGVAAYNPRWSDGHIRQLEQAAADSRYRCGFAPVGPRGALNLGSLQEHGTVELRLFEGTLDYDIAEAWVRFGQRFLNEVLKRKKPLPRYTREDSLLKRVRVGKKASERLLEKAAGGYRDLTFHSF